MPKRIGLCHKVQPCDNGIPPSEPPTLREAVRMIASLGGFLGRKCDGEPGTKTMWLGLQTLDIIVETWKIFYDFIINNGLVINDKNSSLNSEIDKCSKRGYGVNIPLKTGSKTLSILKEIFTPKIIQQSCG